MGWSDDALSLRKPTVVELPRAADRVSYLYMDRVKVWQDDTGVKAIDEDGAITILPAAGLSILMLGPGCSTTTPALTTLHRAGCSLMVMDGAATTAVVPARPLTTRARWSEGQARLWANHRARIEAAQLLYRDRFVGVDIPDTVSLDRLRGIEGRLMREAYRRAAAEHGVTNWYRDTSGDDSVNQLLNLANSILYGSALAAVSALGLNPALGIVHQGAANALLFDLADHHKARCSIPLAFDCGQLEPRVRERQLRTRVRRYLRRRKVIAGHFRLLDRLIGPHMTPDAGDGSGDHLVDENPDTHVPGHTSHGTDEDVPF